MKDMKHMKHMYFHRSFLSFLHSIFLSVNFRPSFRTHRQAIGCDEFGMMMRMMSTVGIVGIVIVRSEVPEEPPSHGILRG